MYSIRQLSTFYSHLQVTSGQMTSLPGHFRSPEVTWRHFLSCDGLLLRATALWEVKCRVKSRHYRVNFGHLRSRGNNVTWLPPPASYSLVGSKICTVYASLLLSTATSRWLPIEWRHFRITSGHLTSFPVLWLPPPASYSLVGSEMYSKRKFSDFRTQFLVTSDQMTSLPGHFGHLRSPYVISCHVTASYCGLLPSRQWNVQYTRLFAFYSHFQVTYGK